VSKRTIVHVITGLGDGGAESVLYRLCLAPSERFRHVVISLRPSGKYAGLLQQGGIEVHSMEMAGGGVPMGGATKLIGLLRSLRPDVVQTWMYHADLIGGVAARLSGCRKVYWNIRHTELVPGATGRSTRAVAAACARLSRLVPKGIVACAERARDVHVSIGYDARRFTVIPNGYDLAQLQPQPAAGEALRSLLGIPRDAPLLGLVGRWNPQKDHANLLRAMALLREEGHKLRLLLVGTGCDHDNPTLRSLIDDLQLGDVVYLLGPRDDVPAVMSAIDLHVLPSSHGEAFPNVVAESMACGTPCVVTDVGDAAMIVGHTGWVVPPADHEALAEAIGAALGERQDAGAWQVRAGAARQRIQTEFSLKRMIAHYEDLWSRP
jgi:glycosyltransferase involved in cell wall biosynthesis